MAWPGPEFSGLPLEFLFWEETLDHGMPLHNNQMNYQRMKFPYEMARVIARLPCKDTLNFD